MHLRNSRDNDIGIDDDEVIQRVHHKAHKILYFIRDKIKFRITVIINIYWENSRMWKFQIKSRLCDLPHLHIFSSAKILYILLKCCKLKSADKSENIYLSI